MSWFSKLNPTPQFPTYTGPYNVGSLDLEIPVSNLTDPSSAPVISDVSTVAFRVFYPCEPSPKREFVTWLPSPQRRFLSAFGRFLGANSTLSDIAALLVQPVSNVLIPACKDAPLLSATTKNKRWPVVFFSHGLGGCRNTYSHLLASVASHGVFVVASCHRDGSAPTTIVRSEDPSKFESVDYITLPHKPTPEVWDARHHQLRIRLRELGFIYDAILKLDGGAQLTNYVMDAKLSQEYASTMVSFRDQLDVHRPGAVTWSGHSFGGATMIQLVKSVYYRSEADRDPKSMLFMPSPDSHLIQQITESSPTIILDLWAMPLQSPYTEWLKEKPMPCYAPNGPGGSAILAVLSQAFFEWEANLLQTKRVLCDDPANAANSKRPGPKFFYPVSSAHLSQSDFGILFPWFFNKTLKVNEPERILKLNVRAILQTLRNNGIEVADTGEADMGDDGHHDEVDIKASGEPKQDWRILDASGNVKSWVHVNVG